MGSASSQLKCPKDYDEEKFNKILKLYDRLDSNGDHSVDMEELSSIANLHVKNQLRKLEGMKQPLSDRTDQKIKLLDQQLIIDIERLKNNCKNSKKTIIQNKNSQLSKIDDEIAELNGLSKDDKSKKIKKAITDKNGNIMFWPFFEYMKTRTNDIPNIEW